MGTAGLPKPILSLPEARAGGHFSVFFLPDMADTPQGAAPSYLFMSLWLFFFYVLGLFLWWLWGSVEGLPTSLTSPAAEP